MSDNGSPMLAGEVAEGLHRLGIIHIPHALAGATHERQVRSVVGARGGPADGHAGVRGAAHAEAAQRRHRLMA